MNEAERVPEWSRHERLKTPEDELNISTVDAHIDTLLGSLGYSTKPIPKENVSVLTAEGVALFGGEGAGAAYNYDTDHVFVSEKLRDSRLRFALRLGHELSHRGTHPVGDVAAYRSIRRFNLLNEAVMSLLERRLFTSLVGDAFYADEVSATEQFKADYPESVQAEMSKASYAEGDVFFIRKHPLPTDASSFTLELRRFPYLREHRLLQKICVKWTAKANIDQKNVEDLLIKTIPSGKLDELKLDMDAVFPEGTFDQIDSFLQSGNVEDLEKFIDSL